MEVHNQLLEIIRTIYRTSEELRNLSFEIQRIMLPYFKNPKYQEKDDISRAALLTRYIGEIKSHIAMLEASLKKMSELIK